MEIARNLGTVSRVCARFVRRFLDDDGAQDLIEYALLAGFISLVTVAAAGDVGDAIFLAYRAIDDLISQVAFTF